MDNAVTEDKRFGFSDLRALYINCTPKRSPEPSHTQLLMDKSADTSGVRGISLMQRRNP